MIQIAEKQSGQRPMAVEVRAAHDLMTRHAVELLDDADWEGTP